MELPLTDNSSEHFAGADDQSVVAEVPETPLASPAKPPDASTSRLASVSDTEQQPDAQSEE